MTGEDGGHLISAGKVARVGFLNALDNVLYLPALGGKVAAQCLQSDKALGACRRLGQGFQLLLQLSRQAHIDSAAGRGEQWSWRFLYGMVNVLCGIQCILECAIGSVLTAPTPPPAPPPYACPP